MNLLLLQLIIASVWFFASVVVDFVTIPTVFQQLKSVTDGVILGGQIGVNVFRQFNILELIWAFSLLGVTAFNKEWNENLGKVKNLLAAFLLIIAILYTFYLSPNITSAHRVISASAIMPEAVVRASEKLDDFHRTYVTVEKFKVVALLGLIITQALTWKAALKKWGTRA